MKPGNEKWVITVSLTLTDPVDAVVYSTPDHWMFYCKSRTEALLLLSELRDGVYLMQKAHVPGAVVPNGRSKFRYRKAGKRG